MHLSHHSLVVPPGYVIIYPCLNLRHFQGKKLPQNKEEDEVSDEDEAADMEDEKVKEDVKKVNKKSKVHLAKELSDCVVICQSVSFKGYEYAELKCKYNGICGWKASHQINGLV